MKNKNINRGPGRPAYDIKWPNGKFTFDDLCEANGVNPKTGKGKFCTKLTLRKGIKRDAASRGRSEIVLLKDEQREPNSKSGLGRKTFVYIRRSKLQTLKAASKSTASVNVGTKAVKPAKVKATKSPATAAVDYEAMKANLLAPMPAVSITPEPEVVVDPTDIVSVPAETPAAPVDETVTAPTAEAVTA